MEDFQLKKRARKKRNSSSSPVHTFRKTDGGVEDLDLDGSENTKTENSSQIVPNHFKSYIPSESQERSENSYFPKNFNRSLSIPRRALSSVKMKLPENQVNTVNGELLNKSEEMPCQPSHQFAKPLNISSRVFEVKNVPENKNEMFFKRTGKPSLNQNSYFYYQPLCEDEQLIGEVCIADNSQSTSPRPGAPEELPHLAISASIRGNLNPNAIFFTRPILNYDMKICYHVHSSLLMFINCNKSE